MEIDKTLGPCLLRRLGNVWLGTKAVSQGGNTGDACAAWVMSQREENVVTRENEGGNIDRSIED